MNGSWLIFSSSNTNLHESQIQRLFLVKDISLWKYCIGSTALVWGGPLWSMRSTHYSISCPQIRQGYTSISFHLGERISTHNSPVLRIFKTIYWLAVDMVMMWMKTRLQALGPNCSVLPPCGWDLSSVESPSFSYKTTPPRSDIMRKERPFVGFGHFRSRLPHIQSEQKRTRGFGPGDREIFGTTRNRTLHHSWLQVSLLKYPLIWHFLGISRILLVTIIIFIRWKFGYRRILLVPF